MKKSALSIAVVCLSVMLLSGCLEITNKNPMSSDDIATPTPTPASLLTVDCTPVPLLFTDYTGSHAFQCTYTAYAVVSTQAEFDEFILKYANKNIYPEPTPVPVDFTKNILVAVFRGMCSSSCYGTAITNLTRGCWCLMSNCAGMPGCGTSCFPRIYATVQNYDPDLNTICFTVITYPQHLILVSKDQFVDGTFVQFQ